MTDELLARAARALREETAGDDASARFTRSRIMASVHDERVKRRTRWAFLAPIAATFIAASAYGAATGKTREVVQAITHALGLQRTEPPPREPMARRRAAEPHVAAPRTPPPAPSASEAVAEPAAPVVATSAESAVSVAAPKPARAAADGFAAAAPARLAAGAGGAGGAGGDPTFELYRAAHQAHFVERDYGRALGAWDAYLKAAPNGALAPEARYNRALCLVRLHRSDEARAALRPFAEGRYGTYRREDAQKLLDALPAVPAGP